MKRYVAKGIRFETLISKADLAIENKFFLETITICYAIIEERLRSVLGKLNNRELGEKHKVDSCIKKIKKETKTNALLRKYFSKELIDKIDNWKETRNDIMHELADQEIEYIKIETCARDGRILMAEVAKVIMHWKKEWEKAKIN